MVDADEEEGSLMGCESPPSRTLPKGDTPASASEHEMDIDTTEAVTSLEQYEVIASGRISPRRPRYLDSDAHHIRINEAQNDWAAQRQSRTLQSPQPGRSLGTPPYAPSKGSPWSGPSRTHTLFHCNYPPMSRYHQYSRCPPKQQIPGIDLTNDAGSAAVWTSHVEAPNRPDGTKVGALLFRASPPHKRHEHPTEEESIEKKLKKAEGDEDEGRREHGMDCE
ncbi:hypothetical protein CTA2_9922 [Colletotrichum tanaceti]|uniref:Uncharacterized protein n=1 Tax=Colletotrichum tanaceti TaxID=1306861 RepID=A0A4U6X3Q8_9PEZI|nr:hypothetical protein CTA2_9922 [Colletotrichum tanaceti]TKW50002.1 hypothetical protein CTA1_5748 [Colletotrichum tanaceti]